MNGLCRANSSVQWKKGWPLRSGELPTLCNTCGTAYEQLVFCDVFHSNDTGWRECSSCGKSFHCGCIASSSLLELLESGGVSCISCVKSSQLHNIIVATPGRLPDHIENKSGFSTRLMGLRMLILGEADHLLDLGFQKDMEKIVDCLPRQRQSLLFSATIPKEVRRISQLVLKREHAYIDTVGLGLETNEKF